MRAGDARRTREDGHGRLDSVRYVHTISFPRVCTATVRYEACVYRIWIRRQPYSRNLSPQLLLTGHTTRTRVSSCRHNTGPEDNTTSTNNKVDHFYKRMSMKYDEKHAGADGTVALYLI